MLKTYSDNELIAKAIGGDPAGYAALVNRHKSYAFTLALRIVKKREDAEEVSQDSFIKAFKSLPNFRMDAKFSTWFYRIVYTTSLNHLRKGHSESTEISEELADGLADPQADASFLLEKGIKKRYIEYAMTRLTTDDSLVLQLYYLDENSLEECGIIMGLEANNIKIRLHRARQRMKIQMQQVMQMEMADL